MVEMDVRNDHMIDVPQCEPELPHCSEDCGGVVRCSRFDDDLLCVVDEVDRAEARDAHHMDIGVERLWVPRQRLERHRPENAAPRLFLTFLCCRNGDSRPRIYLRGPIRAARGGSQAWSTAQGLGPCPAGVPRFESWPPHSLLEEIDPRDLLEDEVRHARAGGIDLGFFESERPQLLDIRGENAVIPRPLEPKEHLSSGKAPANNEDERFPRARAYAFDCSGNLMLPARIQQELDLERVRLLCALLDRAVRVLECRNYVVRADDVARVEDLGPSAFRASKGVQFRERRLRVAERSANAHDLDLLHGLTRTRRAQSGPRWLSSGPSRRAARSEE